MREADLEGAGRLYDRWRLTGKMPLRPEATIAKIRADAEALDLFLEESRRSTGRATVLGGRDLAVYFRDFTTAEAIARAAIVPAKPAATLAYAHRFLAELEVARGRWSDASEHLEQAQRLDPEGTREFAVFLATLPFLSVSHAELARFRDELRATPVEANATGGMLGELRPHLRLHLLALLDLRLGDEAAALALAGDLERLPVSGAAAGVVTSLAHTIRADAARMRGDRGGALEALENVRGELPSDVLASPFFSQDHARYLRAELQFDLGRDEDALRWATHGFAGTPGELVFMAPATLRRAELYDRLGRREDALREYAAFIELWGGADADLQPRVARARERLAALAPEPAR